MLPFCVIIFDSDSFFIICHIVTQAAGWQSASLLSDLAYSPTSCRRMFLRLTLLQYFSPLDMA